MAWTAPKTFTAANVLTAADLNEQLRDNLLETLPAISTTEGSFFVTGPSETEQHMVERFTANARVNAAEQTASTSYVDLTTVGPSVTVTTGTDALVFMSAMLWNDTANAQSVMSYAVTGATTIAANDNTAIITDGVAAISQVQTGSTDLVQTLTPGENTFTCQYHAGGAGTASYSNRFIAVLPM